MGLDEQLDEQNPYRSPALDAGREEAGLGEVDAGADGARRVMEPLTRASGWITFAGVLSVIYGASACLTIIGAIIGWVPLWGGILLIQSQSRIKDGYRKGNPELMREGTDLMRKAIKLWGILTVVMLGLVALFYAVMIIAVVIGGASGSFG